MLCANETLFLFFKVRSKNKIVPVLKYHGKVFRWLNVCIEFYGNLFTGSTLFPIATENTYACQM